MDLGWTGGRRGCQLLYTRAGERCAKYTFVEHSGEGSRSCRNGDTAGTGSTQNGIVVAVRQDARSPGTAVSSAEFFENLSRPGKLRRLLFDKKWSPGYQGKRNKHFLMSMRPSSIAAAIECAGTNSCVWMATLVWVCLTRNVGPAACPNSLSFRLVIFPGRQ
jgi:hypothetical protein